MLAKYKNDKIQRERRSEVSKQTWFDKHHVLRYEYNTEPRFIVFSNSLWNPLEHWRNNTYRLPVFYYVSNKDGGFFVCGDISIKVQGTFRLCFTLYDFQPTSVTGPTPRLHHQRRHDFSQAVCASLRSPPGVRWRLVSGWRPATTMS